MSAASSDRRSTAKRYDESARAQAERGSQCLRNGASFTIIGFSEANRYWSWFKDAKRCEPEVKMMCAGALANRMWGVMNNPHLHANRSKKCSYQSTTVNTVGQHCSNAANRQAYANQARHQLTRAGLYKHPLMPRNDKREDWFLELRDGLCRQTLYAEIGGINCTSEWANFTMHYRWKTFQTDHTDEYDKQRWMRAAEQGRRVFVLLEGGGPHHFVHFPEHTLTRTARRQTLFTHVNDSWKWPKDWLDDYALRTKQLMRRHALPRLPGVCIIWKAMHIGPRVGGADVLHHPSVVDGIHDQLNRIAAAAAQEIGIVYIDLTDITRGLRPAKKVVGMNKADGPEGDPYHGYPHAELAPVLLRRMCAACNGRAAGWGGVMS